MSVPIVSKVSVPKQVVVGDRGKTLTYVHRETAVKKLTPTLRLICTGCVRRGRSVEGHLRSHVRLAGHALQQDPRHEEQAPVFHRRAGYRRLRDLRGEHTNLPLTI